MGARRRKNGGEQPVEAVLEATGTEPAIESGSGRVLWTLAQTAQRCCASRSSVRRWVKNHQETGFPFPVVLGSGRSQVQRFWSDEVEGWLASRPRHQPGGAA